MDNAWRDYLAERPSAKSAYEWRVPSKNTPGITLIFSANMRMRGNGYYDPILSPMFDHWDGYKVSVPPGTQWRELQTSVALKDHEHGGLIIEGAELLPCPYCGRSPTWKGVWALSQGGCIVPSKPHEYTRWWLECCSYAQTPHTSQPLELAQLRNEKLARFHASNKTALTSADQEISK